MCQVLCSIVSIEVIAPLHHIAPLWNIKWTEITWTRLKLCTYSNSSWCTDGRRVVMDSRDKIMLMKLGKMEEGSVISHLFFIADCIHYCGSSSLECLRFYRSACQTPWSFPTTVPKYTISCLCECVPVCHLSQRRWDHTKDSPLVMSLESSACFRRADWLMRSHHLYDQPPLLFLDLSAHTHTHSYKFPWLHKWAVAILWSHALGV